MNFLQTSSSLFLNTHLVVRSGASVYLSLTVAMVAFGLLPDRAQACVRSRSVFEMRVPDLPRDVHRDGTGFSVVRVSYRHRTGFAGTTPSTLDIGRTTNEHCHKCGARSLHWGFTGQVYVKYLSVRSTLAKHFAGKIETSIRNLLKEEYSERIWREHEVTVDILEFPMISLRITFRDSQWPWSRKTVLPDQEFSIFEIFDPGRTSSLQPMFGCGAQALAKSLLESSILLSEDLREVLIDLKDNKNSRFELHVMDPLSKGAYHEVKTKFFEFQCPEKEPRRFRM